MADKITYEKLEQRGNTLEKIALELEWAEKAIMAVSDSMNTLDRSFRIVWANEARAKMHQRSLEEMIGQPCYEMFQRRREVCEGCPVAETLSTGAPCTRERFADRPDGKRIWTETHAWPIFNETGDVTHVVEYARDITERKEAEGKLQESEERYRVLFEMAQDAILVSDETGRFVDVNQAACELLGYSKEELLELGHKELGANTTNTSGYDTFLKVRDRLMKKITSRVNQRKKDGTLLPVEITGSFFERKGQRMAIAIARDISEHERAERMLRESEEKFRAITCSAKDAIMMMDNEGNISYWNEAAQKIFGYSDQEALGKELHMFLAPQKYHDAYRRALRTFTQTGTGAAVDKMLELEAVRKDGSIFPIELSVSAVRIGEKWHATGIVRDISERKQVEKALRTAHDEMARRVEERTAELAERNRQLESEIADRKRAEDEKREIEAQLQQAQKLEAIGTLAGGIAHDFNNLLMGILGNTSLMLLNCAPTQPHYERLKNIERQIQSAARLTNQLLDYARKGRYEVKPLDLNQLVKETSETLGRTKKEISIHLELAEDLAPIEAESSQIQRILFNLFVNAADAMPDGGDLFLKTTNITHSHMIDEVYNPRPGDYIELTVVDTGEGMEKDVLDKIFDPFFTTKEMGRGTGLGLATVYGIITGHGGYVDVESKKGHGTAFRIYLPASIRKIRKIVQTADKSVKGTGTVLLVDDEDIVLRVSKDMLEAMSYRVLTAADGREAVEIYKKNRDKIDIVILDMIMPNMGGGEIYDRIKEIHPGIKVLLSSGYSIDSQATAIMERGCDGFIQKPFGMKELSEKIRTILNDQVGDKDT